jgi:tRNA (guanine37-N1)-methyltransferase
MNTRFDVLTVHPKMVDAPMSESIMGRARARGVAHLSVHDIRVHGLGKHRTVDDTPYGGGPGMVLRVDVVAEALEAVRTPEALVLLTSPSGRVFDQAMANELSEQEHVILICGHYEGIDDRIETLVDGCVSIGDFVMTGGELAAVAIMDAVWRLQPGVLGNGASAAEESFSDGLLEHPQYTRPKDWRGYPVPDVLLSGHHARIESWRHRQQISRTEQRRPDLYSSWTGKKGHKETDS